MKNYIIRVEVLEIDSRKVVSQFVLHGRKRAFRDAKIMLSSTWAHLRKLEKAEAK